MQKKFIALAVAGLVSGAAFAQSNVTIYGVVDVGFVNSSGDRAGTAKGSANYSGIDSGIMSGSRIGFRGEEGLGNGLKAIFTLEYYIAPDENLGLGAPPQTTGAGGSGANSRQTFVGLKSDKLGALTLGRQYAAGFGAVIRNDAMSGATYGAVVAQNIAGRNAIVAGGASRIDNAVIYTSPNWSGLTAIAGYSYGEAGGTATNGVSQGNGGVITAGLNYANGPLNLDVAYHSRQNIVASIAGVTATGNLVAASVVPGLTTLVASGATGDDVNEWLLGGSYDFKVVKLFASYQDMNDKNGTSANEAGNRVWQVGATMPVFGNGKVHFSYADLSWDRTGLGGSDTWALAYTHSLSKRTTLYSAYNHTSYDKNAFTGVYPVGNTQNRGESNDTITVGVNHSF